MPGLALYDTVFNPVVAALCFLIVVAPLVVTYYDNALPHSIVLEGSVGGGALACSPPPVVLGLGEELWSHYRGFLGHVSLAVFVLAGLAATYAFARPLEQRYFFIELTFAGSRLRVLLARLLAAAATLTAASVGASLTLSAIILVAGLASQPGEALARALPLLLASTLYALTLSMMFSLLLRSQAATILALLGYTSLVALLAVQSEDLAVLIEPGLAVLDPSLTPILLTASLTATVAALVRAHGIEY